MPEMPLKNRVAVVTGASSGIGRAVARELVRLGAQVVLNARREESLRELVEELGEEDATAVAGDCADERVINRMLDAARDMLGSPGRDSCLVVVNAGRGLNGSVMTSDTSQWEEMVRTNLLGAARLIRASAERMIRELQSVNWLDLPHDIVVVGSTVGRHVSPFSSMYGSTKFAVHGLVEGARRELAAKGIRVSLVEPAFVESGFQGVAGYDPAWIRDKFEQIGPVLTPEDVAETIAWVVTRPARMHIGDVLVRPTRQDYP